LSLAVMLKFTAPDSRALAFSLINPPVLKVLAILTYQAQHFSCM